jgi:hypothetical protein
MRSVLFLVLLAASSLPATSAIAQTAADKATARQISTHLKESGQLRNYRIGVTYQDGVALLTGSVASAEQRDTAIRLAEQVSGVSYVQSQLQYPQEGASAAGGEARSLSTAFGGKKRQTRPSEDTGVMQAYGDAGVVYGTQAERSPMLARTTSPAAGRRQMPRGNMPLPSPRGAMNPAIQQAAAQGVYQAGGYCPPGYAGAMGGPAGGMGMGAVPAGYVPHAHGRGPSYDNAHMPGYAWPSYASYPNYAALSYPQQYSPTAWPYIGPFYPYPQVPLAWRKVSLEWDDGWWFLDFSAHNSSH